jgi:hypothetical protein
MVKGRVCAILQVKDIEWAERLCLAWNYGVVGKNQQIVVNLHPKSWRQRPLDQMSAYSLFRKTHGDRVVVPPEAPAEIKEKPMSAQGKEDSHRGNEVIADQIS